MQPTVDLVTEIGDCLIESRALFSSVHQSPSCHGMIEIADKAREVSRKGLWLVFIIKPEMLVYAIVSQPFQNIVGCKSAALTVRETCSCCLVGVRLIKYRTQVLEHFSR